MTFLNNTKISTRIIFIVLLPIIALTALSYERYRIADAEKQNMILLEVAFNYMKQISALTEKVQEERNFAMALTGGNKTEEYTKEFEKRVLETDAQLALFSNYIKRNELNLKKLPEFHDNATQILERAKILTTAREFVRIGQNNMGDKGIAVQVYNSVNKIGARIAKTVVFLSASHEQLSTMSIAYRNLLEGKLKKNFNVGLMMRILQGKKWNTARGTKFFVQDNVSYESFNKFLDYGPQEFSKQLKEYIFSESSMKMIKGARKMSASGNLDQFTPDEWFKLSSYNMQLLYAFDAQVRENMLETVTKLRLNAVAKSQKTIAAFLTLVSINIILAFLIIRSIISPLNLLVDNFLRITRTKNLDFHSPVIGTDEFAKASGAFNELIDTIREKNADIHAMLANMRQGLFTINEEGLISEEYSVYLEEIFNTSGLAGQKATEILFLNSGLSEDELSEISEALDVTVGENQINYEFNNHLFIHEYEQFFDCGNKVLSLEWNPIIEDDVVTKLMVTVRDVTALKAMEAEVMEKNRELKIVEQLLNMKSSKFLNFVKSTQGFIEECQAVIEQDKNDPEAVQYLFRNMHTIKGNSRTYNFGYLSDAAHKAEALYSSIRSEENNLTWEQDALMRDLTQVKTIFEEYCNVYFNILGRENNARQENSGFWMDEGKVSLLNSVISRAENELSKIGRREIMRPLQLMLNENLSLPIHTILEDIMATLPNIARQLNKPEPIVKIVDNAIRLHKNTEDLITNTFTHLIRNCLDHGVEAPDERESNGKDRAGLINIELTMACHSVEIGIGDDGRGLNIAALYQKGLELKYWQAGEKVKYSKIAELIFHSGTSTKEKVSSISGRGVGLDAVREFTKQNGSKVTISLSSPDQLYSENMGCCFVPFKIVLAIPEGLYFSPLVAA